MFYRAFVQMFAEAGTTSIDVHGLIKHPFMKHLKWFLKHK